MYNAEFFGTFDVTALVLLVFTLFFFGLVIYLRREDRREGYPLEDDVSGRLEPLSGFFFTARPKVFNMGHGRLAVNKPGDDRDGREFMAARRSQVSGTPLQPVGDPMTAGVGPGAYAKRDHAPDLSLHGGPRIVPLRMTEGFFLDRRDPDPRGMTVLGADRLPAGVVSDVWIDREEVMIRYLEVELTSAPAAGLTVVGAQPAGRRVLLPMTMAVVGRGSGTVKVDAILAAQFAGVPGQDSAEQVTKYEEERIVAYYGAGYLYATPQRSEPLL